MSVSPRLPQGVPPQMLQNMVGRVLGPENAQTGPGPMPQQGPPQGPPPGPPPQGPPPGQQGQPPQDESPEGGPPKEDKGVPPEIAELIKGLMKQPKARDDLEKIVKSAGDEETDKSPLMVIDDVTKLQLAQSWNARVVGVSTQLVVGLNPSPGASVAGDEALLRVYYTTPKGLELEDIDEYADAVRLYLVSQGWDNVDKIEDQTMRYCFVLRETQIKSAGRTKQEQVDFVRAMAKLTEKWLDKYGALPEPDWKVIEATEQGKGDPESQIRDIDSSALAGQV